MKVIGLILALCLLSRTALAAPCTADDNECLLRLTLQQTNELEACRLRESHLQRSNDLLSQSLKEEEARQVSGPKVFIMGMIVGVIFVGLGSTIAFKAVKK